MDFFDFLKSNKFIILLISIFLNILLLILSVFLVFKLYSHECICENSNLFETNIEEIEPNTDFYVEIKGAVNNPGVYKANSNSIINDIVTLAGGFTKKAYTKNINLSRKVSNELVIYVFTESEYKKTTTKIVQTTCDCSTYDISNCTDNKVSEIISSEKDTVFEDSIDTENIPKLVNINTASKEELMNLSGIGESKAEDIIEYRTTSGNFKNIEEIKNVSGIGDALFNKIKDSITI